MIRGIPKAALADEWDKLEPFLQNMCDRSHSRWHLEGLRNLLETGAWQAWVADDYAGVAFTSIHPEAVTVQGVVGKDRGSWAADGMKAIEEWAAALGKQHVVTSCRTGWVPFLKELGFRETHREMVKKV